MAGPNANCRERREVRKILKSALQHFSQNDGIDPRIMSFILARRTDQELSCLARLEVECDRVCADGMGALQITKLNELMANRSGIAIGDNKMTFAGANANSES